MKIITPEVKERVKRLSAYMLPDDPSGRRWKPDEIKRTLYEPVLELLELLGSVEAATEDMAGSLNDLNTENKSTLVAAVNEVLSKLGTGSSSGSPTITVDGSPVYSLAFDEDPQEQLDKLKRELSDLLYQEIAITSFTASPAVAEMGAEVDGLTLQWTLNKEAVVLELSGGPILGATGTTGAAVPDGQPFTSARSWMLSATDERAATARKTATLTFCNGVYYGTSAAPGAVDSAFILGLTKTLASSRVRNITVNAGDGQYIWYCLPVRLGECSFSVGGFDGGFDLVSIIDFTNASGYTESYRIYRSTNAGLGQTTVEVS